MNAPSFSNQRRGLLFAGGAALLLSACGGSGGDDPPEVVEFSADRSSYFVGEEAVLTVRYRGASARIEPDIGAVRSGMAVRTGVLAQRRRYQLVVETPGHAPQTRDLWVDVGYRDRWAVVGDYVSTYHASLMVEDGSIVVTGGSRGQRVLSDAVDRYDATARRFERIATLANGRSNHSAVWVATNKVLVFGGSTTLTGGPSSELVDVATGQVVATGPLNQTRNRHAALRLGDGRVLVVGGYARDSAEVWEPATGRWRLLASRMAHDREYHSATELGDGRVLVAGGYSAAAAAGVDYVFAEIFDPRTDTFTPLATGITERRSMHAAHHLSDHSVLLLGGEVVDTAIRPLASVLRFDPATATFAAQPALAAARTLSTTVRVPGDEVLFFGGQTDDEMASPTGAAWRAGVQRNLAPLPSGRLWHTAHRLLDGRVLVIGGDDGAGNYVPQALLYE